MTPRASIARRIAAVSAAAAAVTAIVSAAVPLLVVGLRLTAADERSAESLAAAIEVGIARESAQEPTLARAARDVLDESALDGTRMEVWAPSGLIAARGPGAPLGPGRGTADAGPRRETGRVVVRRASPTGLVISVAVPISFSPALRREMTTSLLLGVLPLSALAALISVRLARRALAPLSALAAEVARRPAGGPWEPLVTPSADAEVVRLAEALNDAGERLTRALAAEREFAAYAAHALRTPLTRLAAEAHSGTRPAGGSLETLRRLVDSLLVLVRTGVHLGETGATVNVADLVRRAASSHAGSSRPFFVDAPDEALVRGDEELLLAALEHLLENAAAYSPAGAPVHLSVSGTDGRVTLAVRDEGPGIPPGERERIFQPFVRGTAAALADGSGLGLALVRRIAEGHGGTARAVPVGAGTRFELDLPAWRPR